MRTAIIILSTTLALSSSSFAQDANKTPNFCKEFSETECTASVGCKFIPAQVWVRQSDGKESQRKARCTYDSKAAKALVYDMVKNANASQ